MIYLMKSFRNSRKKVSRLLNTNGAVLVYTIIIILILTILSAAILSVGAAYVSRSIRNNSERQAYLTARSALYSVVSKVDGASTTVEMGEREEYIDYPIPASGMLEIESFDFSNDNMGEASATIERLNETTLRVTAIGKSGEVSESLSAYINRETEQIGFIEGFIGLHCNQLDHTGKSSIIHINNGDLYLQSIQHGNKRKMYVNYFYYTTNGNVPIHKDGAYNYESLEVYANSATYVPERKASINIEWPEIHNPVINNESITLQPDIAYIISNNYNNNINIPDEGNYYIAINNTNNVTLNLVLFLDARNSPNVYIKAQNSKVYIAQPCDGNDRPLINTDNTHINTYIFSDDNSTLTIARGVTLCGAVTAHKLILEGNPDNHDTDVSFTLNYVPPMQDGNSNSGLTIYTWALTRYAKE